MLVCLRSAWGDYLSSSYAIHVDSGDKLSRAITLEMNALRRSPTSQRQKDASACSSSVSDKLAVAHMAADSSDASLERLDISTQRDLDFLATVAADALLDWIDNSVQAYLDILTENSVDASMALLSTSIQSMEEDTIDEQNTRAAHGDAIASGDAVCAV